MENPMGNRVVNRSESFRQIVDGGYCIGCGVCHSASNGVVPVAMDEYGRYQAGVSEAETLSEESLQRVLAVCPFSDEGPNEDVIGKRLFDEQGSPNSGLGYYKDLYIGHVAKDDFRASGASGGVITWLLTELLQRGEVDAVVHVKKVEDSGDGVLFRYGISRTAEEIVAGAKSRYYPIEMSEVLDQIKQNPGRYVVVGLPCFIKAIRRLAEIDPVIKERVVFCIGLVCGHLKSKAFADCFGWQAGISPGDLKEIDFRVKIPERAASDYGVLLRSDDKKVVKPTRELFGANWGHNFFRYSACDYCDDVFAETADVSVGDAWLPSHVNDSGGNSIVVVRHPLIAGIFLSERINGSLKLDEVDAELLIQSQAGGLRDRREGLGYRLYLKECAGEWTPMKRVQPSCTLTRLRKKIYNYRLGLPQLSHEVWRQAVLTGDFEFFRSRMQPDINRLSACYRSPILLLLGRIKRRLLKCLSGSSES